ncbi:hypothetical protein GLW08_16655 [Pontibacillus yanchengensis]|uniref:Uncharacterized protein n=2 Tax=Pontibacillus yanchengensis TaxID=462910 RepID=A0ACC7VJ42_9BACI|nr:hypothetical protein [Pontibacillus yanchengensis]MYL32572.1 hypothetical protein [Pontibacillus yanchengensis]MYL54966.1 hypothetical protein [Pontibacillus yanchengensis]
MKGINLFIFTIISSIILILFRIIWQVIGFVSLLLLSPFLVVLAIVHIMLVVWAVVVLIRKRNWRPILVHVITIVVLFIPFNNMMVHVKFNMNKSDFKKVVEMVESKELEPNVPNQPTLIKLPDSYDHLSSGGGEIRIKDNGNQLSILFYRNRGILDNYTGYLYAEDSSDFGEFGLERNDVNQLEDYWYYVTSN